MGEYSWHFIAVKFILICIIIMNAYMMIIYNDIMSTVQSNNQIIKNALDYIVKLEYQNKLRH
jgi:hypothetical protein